MKLHDDRTVDWRVDQGVDVSVDELRARFVELGAERDKLLTECAIRASEQGKIVEERDALRLMMIELLASARPHPVEHPTMFAAWERAKKLLAKYGQNDARAAHDRPSVIRLARSWRDSGVAWFWSGDREDFGSVILEAGRHVATTVRGSAAFESLADAKAFVEEHSS